VNQLCTRDTYRTLLPLYHLLYTPTYSRVLQGLLNIFKYEGYLPAGRIANWNGRVQGGTHADMVLADAYVKNGGELGSNIDWNEAYYAVLNDALSTTTRNLDPVAFDGATKEGRGASDDYLKLHYITRNHTRSISRGVEYSQNDFAIYSMAQSLPNATASDVESFRQRADWWQNQWSAEANTSLFIPSVSNSTGNTTFSGFPAPRNSDGSWNFTAYNPLSCGGCGWGDDIYESKVWETAFAAAPHDMSKVIELMGGDDKFVQRLDTSFLPGFGTSVGANNDAGSALFNPGKCLTLWEEVIDGFLITVMEQVTSLRS
jgi:putative alpha-1,2-mannosidase